MSSTTACCEVSFMESVNTADVEQRETAEEEILDWRFEQLLHVGYERRQARVLSRRREVDLHQAVDLVGRGCPHALALQILL
jgi:primosomal protein N''